MPIYAYKCGSCGHAKDVLQKISDAPQTQCPACGKEAWSKQLSAPGFQLKGTGWYATDFKNGGTSAPAGPTEADKAAPSAETPAGAAASSASAESAGSSVANGAGASTSSTSTAAKPAPVAGGAVAASAGASSSASSSTGGCGASCACH